MTIPRGISRTHTRGIMDQRSVPIILAVSLIAVCLLFRKHTPQHPDIAFNGYPLLRANKFKGVFTHLENPVSSSDETPIPEFVLETYGAVQVAHRTHEDPKGVVLLFHGCGESARTWKDLPEHHAITKALYKRRFSTLAVTSANRGTKCWSGRFPAGENEDVGRVLLAIREYLKLHRHEDDIPVHGVGVSSGGSFLSVLSTTGRLASQILYISSGNKQAFRHSRRGYPRTLFVHAKHDPIFPAHRIEEARRELVSRGVNVAVFPQQPPGITRSLYSTRVPELHPSHSARLAAARDADTFSRLVTSLPREFRDGVAQVRKVAEGGHAVSSNGVDDIVGWI